VDRIEMTLCVLSQFCSIHLFHESFARTIKSGGGVRMPKQAEAAEQPARAASGELLVRVRCEFLEMPGLQLTARQAAKFWNLEHETACALLDALVGLNFLTKTKLGAYAKSVD
jgi:hypothetical protein